MVGTLSQLVALCSAANCHLAGRFNSHQFFPDHSEFQYCNQVSFIQRKRNWLGRTLEIAVAADPNSWLRQIKDGGATKALLRYASSGQPRVPDHKLAGFVGGGGTWSLILRYANRDDQWQARWQVTQRDDPTRRIWTVTYGLIGSSECAPELQLVCLDELALRFRAVLSEAIAFAAGHPQLRAFNEMFERALTALDVDAHFPDYVDFVCLDSYPPNAQRLLAASYCAWVFGGMGSWNDNSFESPDDEWRYEDISTNLYSVINEAIQHSANSFGVT